MSRELEKSWALQAMLVVALVAGLVAAWGMKRGWWPMPQSDDHVREIAREECRCPAPVSCADDWRATALATCMTLTQETLATADACLTKLEAVRAKGGGL